MQALREGRAHTADRWRLALAGRPCAEFGSQVEWPPAQARERSHPITVDARLDLGGLVLVKSGAHDWPCLYIGSTYAAGQSWVPVARMAIVQLMIRWGAYASSDRLRQCARCSHCGCKGASLRRPSWTNAVTGWQPFSVERMIEVR